MVTVECRPKSAEMTMLHANDATKSMAQLLHEGNERAVLDRLEQPTLSIDELTKVFKSNDALCTAVCIGYTDVIQRLLARPDVASLPDYVLQPLVLATKRDRADILALFAARNVAWITTFGGTTFARKYCGGLSLLHYAASNHAHNVLVWLLDHGVPATSRSDFGDTPLHEASRERNERALTLLLRAGADINATNDDGCTALHVIMTFPKRTSLTSTLAFLRRLCIYQVDIEARNLEGCTAMDLAKDDDFRLLFSKESAFRSQYPVHYMARSNDVAAINAWLADNIASAIATAMITTDNDGRTVLMRAVEALDLMRTDGQVLTELLPHLSSSDFTRRDQTGRSALEYLLEKDIICKTNRDGASNVALIQALDALSCQSTLPLQFALRVKEAPHGGKPPQICCGACSDNGRSSTVPFATLASTSKWDELESSLRTATDFEEINGGTVLHYVCSKGNMSVLQALLQQTKLQLDVRTRDKSNAPAITVAVNRNFEDGVRLLLRAGAHHGIHEPYSAARAHELYSQASASKRLVCDNWALQHRYPAYHLVRLLNIAEADSCIQTKESALHLAVRQALPIGVLDQLLARDDVDVDAPNADGETALLVASKLGRMEHATCLLANGADVCACDTIGWSSLQHAASQHNLGMMEQLLAHIDDLPLRKEFFWGNEHVFGDDVAALYVREETMRRDSKSHQLRRATCMATLRVDDAFETSHFLKALTCSTTLVQMFLHDCVSMGRDDATFSHLDIVYGKCAHKSALYAILHLKLGDADMTFGAQQACLEHAVFRRLLEIKWELFGRRMYVERLLLHLLLLVTMTISSILFDDALPSTTTYSIGLTTTLLVGFGVAAAQCLRPRVVSSAFRPRDLVVLTGLSTLALAVPLLYHANALRLPVWYATLNHAVLGATVAYFVWNEIYEMRGNRAGYWGSSLNVVQLFNYTAILSVFLPLKLGWLSSPNQVQAGIGALLTSVLWVLSFQFLEVVSSASYLLPMMTHLFGDIANFFVFFGVFQCGLTLIFYQLFVLTSDPAFSSLGQSFSTAFFVLFGQVPLASLQAFDDPSDPFAPVMYTGTSILMMAHSVILGLVLSNVLIAMFSHTLEKCLANAKAQALITYAWCILRLEMTMNLSEADVLRLTHHDVDGKLQLRPIFSQCVPKSKLGLSADQAEALAQHTTERAAWHALMRKLETAVDAQIQFVRDALLHVAHFTDMNVPVAFASELHVLDAMHASLQTLVATARRSRSPFREKILPTLQRKASKVLRRRAADINAMWRRTDDPTQMNDHDQCMLLFQLNQHTTIEAPLTVMVHTILAAIDSAFQIERVTEDPATCHAKRMTAMATQLATVEKQNSALSTELQAMAAQQTEMLSLLTKMSQGATPWAVQPSNS
ncbi:hypothetical protein SPRG_04222 [Saprolegnia parasitica CBS 223.65]|uniref:Ion transport domain-containing protein n=1 Tax=Saprolegnia parasitica (strain CBS 223.65) TaxID=695850 RepID=A0A067CP62_SAPPC|nr:hypothetical protein SPRG_04222 [Saprolegnia parasitica CBS 223.65]KDO31035.1 hypothetical protein SPRG_04222 [Saprolegnia parasitica CBS 223.65]|eukprot:XP_012198212.1 hypothetical protein SPRG_04222 [Saprolegnia parasitica CBS 223.65]